MPVPCAPRRGRRLRHARALGCATCCGLARAGGSRDDVHGWSGLVVMGSGASGGGCVSLPPWCSVLGALPCGVSSVLAPFMWDWVVAAGATPGRFLGCAWGRLLGHGRGGPNCAISFCCRLLNSNSASIVLLLSPPDPQWLANLPVSKSPAAKRARRATDAISAGYREHPSWALLPCCWPSLWCLVSRAPSLSLYRPGIPILSGTCPSRSVRVRLRCLWPPPCHPLAFAPAASLPVGDDPLRRRTDTDWRKRTRTPRVGLILPSPACGRSRRVPASPTGLPPCALPVCSLPCPAFGPVRRGMSRHCYLEYLSCTDPCRFSLPVLSLAVGQPVPRSICRTVRSTRSGWLARSPLARARACPSRC